MAARVPLALVAELEQKKTIVFAYRDAEGISREGFLAWHKGEIRAYENRCKHLPLPLDYGDGRFFAADGERIICSSHGAIYEPLSGQCIEGPCNGVALNRLEIKIENGTIFLETQSAQQED